VISWYNSWAEHIEDIIGTGPGNSPANSRKASACSDVQHLAVSDSLISAIPKLKALSWGLPYISISGKQTYQTFGSRPACAFRKRRAIFHSTIFSGTFVCHPARDYLHQNMGFGSRGRLKACGSYSLIQSLDKILIYDIFQVEFTPI